MKLVLPDSVSSLQDIRVIVVEVRGYARWYSHDALKKRFDTKHTSEPPVISSATTALMQEWHAGKPVGQASLDKLIAVLEDFETTAPSVAITLAAPPNSGLKKTLVSWCRANIAPTVLVSFEFNTTLLGGMVVRSGSHIYDWSFRRQILEAREHFPEVLRNV